MEDKSRQVLGDAAAQGQLLVVLDREGEHLRVEVAVNQLCAQMGVAVRPAHGGLDPSKGIRMN